LINAWDVASARVLERTGVRAIATSSAGIAFSLGLQDGERIGREQMLAAVERIATRVRLPVTADMEAGYGPRPEDAAATARGVVEAGAVGLNLEDGRPDRSLAEVGLQLEKIRAVREAGAAAGVPLVLNARTDAFEVPSLDPAARLREAVRRANAYRAAGADCLFVPFVSDAPTIARLAREIDGPLNVLGSTAAPPLAELARLGVRRVSFGSAPMRAGLGVAVRLAEELRERGTCTTLAERTLSFDEMQQLLGERA
jgi:2-methylisocitrate lyase-like PEP mutase family enzyme